MVELAEVKEYLRIPYDDEDTFIQTMIDAGYIYLENAVEYYHELYESNESFSNLADFWVKTQWCPTAYDNREGMLAGNVQLSYTARSIITQLQLYTYTEGGD